ncbi:TPA: RdgB/HAM1 family non-canonical purine NTP pyrophosphatase [bacterium]|jgi:XTP/dITP diphosphohydrolase|nr:RdgB/HAM1 family non-canonical purine NTP pyrophosphatase [bacterium]
MKTFILATENEHKYYEFNQILKDTGIKLLSLKDLSLTIDVEENGDSYKENAKIKAKFIYEKTKIPTIADDSGLEIEALDNFPGVKSSRFEEGKPYKTKNEIVLDMMKDKTNRNATFKCSLCVYGLSEEPLFFEGEFKGEIAQVATGKHGFGYDPIFYFPKLNKTAAMMNDEEKNTYSHRAVAIHKFKEYLESNLKVNEND